jgi:precorrin-6x reductase
MNKKVLVFAGTLDGRRLIQKLLAKNVYVTASSLTEHGNALLEKHPLLTKRFGAIETQEISEFLESNGFDMVIDATHPYADKISNHILHACQKQNVRLFRLERETAFKPEEGLHFKTIRQACHYLKNKSGHILFTTGSNNIPEIVEILPKDRLIFRILPIKGSIEVAKKSGLGVGNLLPLNPPFSVEDNINHIKKHKVKYLVTKDSGVNGGCIEKSQAAKEMKIELIIIDRPMSLYNHVYYSDEKIIDEIIR